MITLHGGMQVAGINVMLPTHFDRYDKLFHNAKEQIEEKYIGPTLHLQHYINVYKPDPNNTDCRLTVYTDDDIVGKIYSYNDNDGVALFTLFDQDYLDNIYDYQISVQARFAINTGKLINVKALYLELKQNAKDVESIIDSPKQTFRPNIYMQTKDDNGKKCLLKYCVEDNYISITRNADHKEFKFSLPKTLQELFEQHGMIQSIDLTNSCTSIKIRYDDDTSCTIDIGDALSQESETDFTAIVDNIVQKAKEDTNNKNTFLVHHGEYTPSGDLMLYLTNGDVICILKRCFYYMQ